MSTSPQGPGDYVRRNLPPLIVGLAALVAIVGGLIVVVDRVRDDDDDDARVQQSAARSEADDRGTQLGGGLSGLFQSFAGDQILLGVTVTEDDGALVVESIVRGSPAADAGIEVGDEIREVGGDRVRSTEELRDAVASVDFGDEYEIVVRRDGDEETLTARRELDIAAMVASLLERLSDGGLDLEDFDFSDFDLEGFDLEDFDFGSFDFDDFDLEDFDLEDFDLQGFDLDQLRERFRFRTDPAPFEQAAPRPTLGVSVVQTSDGLRVVRVQPGSVAAAAGFLPGDVIRAVDGRSVRTIEEFLGALPSSDRSADPRFAGGETVELRIARDGREFVLLALFQGGIPFQILPGGVPRNPELPLAPPTPDLFAQRLLEELNELESFLGSEDFLDDLGERLSDRIEAFLDGALADLEADRPPDSDDAAPDSDPGVPSSFAELDVFRGTVEILTDVQITLGGSRGAISFTLTDDTTIVGVAPTVGGISTVASNEDLEAILVLTPN